MFVVNATWNAKIKSRSGFKSHTLFCACPYTWLCLIFRDALQAQLSVDQYSTFLSSFVLHHSGIWWQATTLMFCTAKDCSVAHTSDIFLLHPATVGSSIPFYPWHHNMSQARYAEDVSYFPQLYFPQELTLQISLLYKTPEFATLTDAAG